MTADPLLDLADACQKAADEISDRLTDFAHPLNAAFRDQLNDRESTLRVTAHALRLQALGALAAQGSQLRQTLDQAARAALAAVGTIQTAEGVVTLTGAMLGLAGAIATAVASGNPAGLLGAAQAVIAAAQGLATPGA